MCLEFGTSTIKIKVGLWWKGGKPEWCNGEKWGSQGKNLNTLRNFVTDAFVYYISVPVTVLGIINAMLLRSLIKPENATWECKYWD